MIKSIWKYELLMTAGAQRVSMPKGAITPGKGLHTEILFLIADITRHQATQDKETT